MAREGGEIRASIARHPSHRKRMAVRDDDSGARRHTKSAPAGEIKRRDICGSADFYRTCTHQIRVHFQFLGYPVVGDETYGARQNKKLAEMDGYKAPRVMLYARKSFQSTHPRTKKKMDFSRRCRRIFALL